MIRTKIITKTKSTFLALLTILLSPMAANADVIEITGAGENDGLWEIVLVEGTYTELSDLLNQQVWWGNAELADIFAETLAGLMGLPLSDETLGPLFAILTGPCGDAIECSVSSGYFPGGGDNYWAYKVNAQVVYATARSVPEPGTLALLGLGLAGMGFTRRKKTA